MINLKELKIKKRRRENGENGGKIGENRTNIIKRLKKKFA